MTILAVTARERVADYVDALVTVYWIIIIAWILLSWMEMLGVRIPYNRVTSAIIGFVREAAEPYLRIFRRFIPPFGGFDLSPIVAILVLIFAGRFGAALIRG